MLYSHDPSEGDSELHARDLRSNVDHVVPRGESARFSHGDCLVVFLIKPELALVREAQGENDGRDSALKDSLGILNLASGAVTRVERVKSFELTEEEGGWVAFLLEEAQTGAAIR